MKIYLVAERGHDYCLHERAYATREQAERNAAVRYKGSYARYLTSHARDLKSGLPETDPSPKSFSQWLESHQDIVIDELEMVGLPEAVPA